MVLVPGKSKKAMRENIVIEEKLGGKPRKQAYEIAKNEAKKTSKKSSKKKGKC